MSNELSSTIIPSKFMIVLLHFILGAYMANDFNMVVSSEETLARSGRNTFDNRSKLASCALTALTQLLQLFLMVFSHHHFYHKMNIFSSLPSAACILNSSGLIVLSISGYYSVTEQTYWLVWLFLRWPALTQLASAALRSAHRVPLAAAAQEVQVVPCLVSEQPHTATCLPVPITALLLSALLSAAIVSMIDAASLKSRIEHRESFDCLIV